MLLLVWATTPVVGAELTEFDLDRIRYWESVAEEEGDARLRDRARSHLRQRRKDVPEYRDAPRDPIPLLADLADAPVAYEDVPVVLWGRVTNVEEPSPEGFTTLDANFHDDDRQPLRVIVQAGKTPPVEGDPFVGIGFFLTFDSDRRPTFYAVRFDVLGDRVDVDVLGVVEHEETLQPAERDAYFTTIVQARMAETDRLRRLAREFRDERAAKFRFDDPDEFPTFVDLFKHRDRYLGRPVTLRGHTWSITRIPAFAPSEGDEAEYGIKAVYQIQLYTPNSQTNAATVVCTELPEGLPTSGHLDERIDGLEVTGFFFKMGKYHDQQNQGRKIPIVVARTVSWRPPASEVTRIPEWVYWVSVGGIAGLIAVVGWITLRDRAGRDRARRRLDEVEAPSFEGLDDPPLPNLEETDA